MFGQSIPFAGPAGFIAGYIAGEIAGAIAKEMGGGEQAQRVACQAAHAGTSALTGWVINAALLDVTGVAAQAGVALAGAGVHDSMYASAHHPTGFAGLVQAQSA